MRIPKLTVRLQKIPKCSTHLGPYQRVEPSPPKWRPTHFDLSTNTHSQYLPREGKGVCICCPVSVWSAARQKFLVQPYYSQRAVFASTPSAFFHILCVRNMHYRKWVSSECCVCVCCKMYALEGRFTFTSHSAGEHVICIHSNSTAWFSAAQLVSITVMYNYMLIVYICV